MPTSTNPGTVAAPGAATLSGVATPCAKLLLRHMNPCLLAGAVAFGGSVALVLLPSGVASMTGSGTVLLRNANSMFTMALTWLAFREHIGSRILSHVADSGRRTRL